ncbi:hypothetical protein [Candidatus Clostridium radicumherbarum]|uniref:Uncharacterized protein n=1 Tax=Candidatus Clostridium radicumherbarum TaxID=3381662 RepID=A0ABW8TNW0_9CLOT
MYYRNNNEQDYSNNESGIITTENLDADRRKHTDKYYMEMPYMMAPMSYCPSMETCPMKNSCPMMGELNMMSQMDPVDPDPRFGRRFHHFHHHFHHHFFHPFFPHFHHHGF